MEELTRKPVVVGSFYPEESSRLKKEVEGCFLSEFGPGKFPPSTNLTDVKGIIVPHAGYQYSGAAAAHAYNAISNIKPDIIVILGPAHTGLGKVASIWQGSDWETPLGLIKIDRVLALNLKGELYDFDLEPHLQEHSIEVQLPFLQTIYQDNLPLVVPILYSVFPEFEICRELGRKLADAIQKSNKKVLLIASSDFTHYGVNYGFLPFFGPKSEISRKLAVLDYKAIDKIEKLDVKDFIEYVKDESIPICGATAIAVFLFALRELGAEKGQLLKYYTSGDITNDFSSSVSYASIVFK